MEGLLLGKDGRTEGASTVERTRAALAAGADPERRDRFDEILENLRLSSMHAGPFEPRAAQFWREPLYITIADGAQVLSTATETFLVPDFTVPAGYAYQGKTLKYTLFGDASFAVTTPGTWILSLRWGGVSGTVMAVSSAIAPSIVVGTTKSWVVEWYTTFRNVGTAAASFTMGKVFLCDIDATSAATVAGNLNMFLAPAAAPAAVNVNTTIPNALTPTVKHSVTTGQTTCHMAILESLA